MERFPVKCSQCGAPVKGDICDHCGASFQTGCLKLFLCCVGNHRKLILDLLNEMAEIFFDSSNQENSRRLASAVSAVRSLDSERIEPPLLLLSSTSPAALSHWKNRIEANGGEARIE